MVNRSPPLPRAGSDALFLDFDGTLINFAQTPDGIEVSNLLHDLISKLSERFRPAFAFVTGRAVDNLRGHLKRDDIPIAGAHGAEWTTGGAVSRLASLTGFDKAIAPVRALADRDGRLVMEIKSGGLTLHFRRAPERAQEALEVLTSAFAGLPDFTIMPGHMMIEARHKEADKGRAIERFMELDDFAGRRPVFIGDDVTDEFGFDVVNRMGGVSVRVGPGETIARYRLGVVGEVHQWLQTAVET